MNVSAATKLAADPFVGAASTGGAPFAVVLGAAEPPPRLAPPARMAGKPANSPTLPAASAAPAATAPEEASYELEIDDPDAEPLPVVCVEPLWTLPSPVATLPTSAPATVATAPTVATVAAPPPSGLLFVAMAPPPVVPDLQATLDAHGATMSVTVFDAPDAGIVLPEPAAPVASAGWSTPVPADPILDPGLVFELPRQSAQSVARAALAGFAATTAGEPSSSPGTLPQPAPVPATPRSVVLSRTAAPARPSPRGSARAPSVTPAEASADGARAATPAPEQINVATRASNAAGRAEATLAAAAAPGVALPTDLPADPRRAPAPAQAVATSSEPVVTAAASDTATEAAASDRKRDRTRDDEPVEVTLAPLPVPAPERHAAHTPLGAAAPNDPPASAPDASDRATTASLHLDAAAAPRHGVTIRMDDSLGRWEFDLVRHDRSVDVTLRGDASVQSAVAAALPEFKGRLAENGLSLHRLDVVPERHPTTTVAATSASNNAAFGDTMHQHSSQSDARREEAPAWPKAPPRRAPETKAGRAQGMLDRAV